MDKIPTVVAQCAAHLSSVHTFSCQHLRCAHSSPISTCAHSSPLKAQHLRCAALCSQVLRLLYGEAVQITPDNVLTFMHLADFYGVPQLLSRTAGLLDVHVTVHTNNCCAQLCEAAALRCTQVPPSTVARIVSTHVHAY